MDKSFFVVSWYGSTLISLIFSILFLIYLSTPKIIPTTSNSYQLYSALPENQASIADEVQSSDARAKIIEDFFKAYKSTLADYSQLFIEVSDHYHLDFRLLPAISMQESNGGKRVPDNSFNPFGFGIYGSKALKFSSWEEGIEIVARSLRQDYLDQGLHTPTQIMTKYTPPSLAKGGSWAIGVSSFMEELR